EHLAEDRKVSFSPDNTQEIILLQASTAGRMDQLLFPEQSSNTGTGRKTQAPQLNPVQRLAFYGVDKGFIIILGKHTQQTATLGHKVRRYFHLHPASHPGQTGTLNQQRNQHYKKSDIKVEAGIIHF